MIGSSAKEIPEYERKIMSEFEMSDLGPLSYFLGIEFKATEFGTMMH